MPGAPFDGDVHLLFKLLLPLHHKRVYNMKDRQLVKALADIFGAACVPRERCVSLTAAVWTI